MLAKDNYITLFEKFIGIINWNLLQKYIVKLDINYKAKSFFTADHLVTMVHFYLCQHDSLRDLNQGRLEQMSGVLPSISLGALSTRNNTRDYRVFILGMNDLIKTCMNILTRNQRIEKFGTVKMIDFTTILLAN